LLDQLSSREGLLLLTNKILKLFDMRSGTYDAE